MHPNPEETSSPSRQPRGNVYKRLWPWFCKLDEILMKESRALLLDFQNTHACSSLLRPSKVMILPSLNPFFSDVFCIPRKVKDS